jgi:hypothetical protein
MSGIEFHVKIRMYVIVNSSRKLHEGGGNMTHTKVQKNSGKKDQLDTLTRRWILGPLRSESKLWIGAVIHETSRRRKGKGQNNTVKK